MLAFAWHVPSVSGRAVIVLLQPIDASLFLPTLNQEESGNRVVECRKTVPCCFSTGYLIKTEINKIKRGVSRRLHITTPTINKMCPVHNGATDIAL